MPKCRPLIVAMLVLLAVFFSVQAKPATSATAQWIVACRNPDGGYGLYPGDGSNLPATCWAVQALQMLDVKIPSPKLTRAYVRSRQNPDGGFKSRWGVWPDTSQIKQTFYAAKALQVCGFQDIDTARMAAYIHSRQRTAEGGYEKDFWWYPERTLRAFTAETYYGVQALAALGRAPANAGNLKQWLKDRQVTQHNDGGFCSRQADVNGPTPEANSYTYSTGMALLALSALTEKPLQPEQAAAYLKKQQQPEGGFTMGLGHYREYSDARACRMTDAYWAVEGLGALGKGVPDTAKLTSWVSSCQQPDGGFGRRPQFCPSEMQATFEAVSIFKALRRSLPNPAKPLAPVRDTQTIKPAYVSEQMTPTNADEMRYLFRIAKPLYARYAGQGTLAAALKLKEWVNQNLVFGDPFTHSGAATILENLGGCGGQARAYVSLANVAGIESRMIYLAGHVASESRLNGRWVVIDPVFNDYGRDCQGNLKSALQIHLNFLKNGDQKWTRFGDWRYESLEIEKPDGVTWEIKAGDTLDDALRTGAYSLKDY